MAGKVGAGRFLAALIIAPLLLAGACGTTSAVSKNSKAFHDNIAKQSALTDVGRREAEVIYGTGWKPPSEFDLLVQRISIRFNATGVVTVPAGLIRSDDCPGPIAIALTDGRIVLCRDFFLQRNRDGELISEDEIAFIIGHELGHLARRHNVRDGLPGGIITAGTLATLGVVLALHDPTGATGWTQLLALAGGSIATSSTAAGYVNTWKLPQELEADQIGFDLVAHAGYSTEIALNYLEDLPDPAALLTNEDLATRNPHPDRDRRVAEAKAYISRMKYIDPDTYAPPLPWADQAGQSEELRTYLLGREEIRQVSQLSLAINIFSMQSGNTKLNRDQRNQAETRLQMLCPKALDLARSAISHAGTDRNVVREAAAMAWKCDHVQGYNWLSSLARSPGGGLHAVDDLIGYQLYGNMKRFDADVRDVWTRHVVPNAYQGAAYKFAYGMASQYLRNDMAYDLSEECEKHEKQTKTGCGWVGMKASWGAGADENGKRSWSEILPHVQAPTVKMVDRYWDQAFYYIQNGRPLPPYAQAVLNGAESDRRAMAWASIELNVRAGPGMNFPIVTVIPREAQLKLRAGRQGSWAEVEYNNIVGWASMSYLRVPR